MVNNTASLTVKVNKEDKEKATKILDNLGLSINDLINMTLKQVILKGGIPFDVDLKKDTKNNEDENANKRLVAKLKSFLDDVD